MKTFKILAQLLYYPESVPAEPVGDLHLFSQEIAPGDVFIALPGHQAHGLHYAPEAIARGAKLIITDKPYEASVPVWVVPDIKHRLAAVAKAYYDAPDEKLDVVGVTGTNGKSSTTWYIAQLAEAVEISAAVIGTLGQGRLPKLEKTKNTTPDVVSLYRLLHTYVEQGIQLVAMEVSSHAIAQGRIEGVKFFATVLTNLGRDHLDYHGSEAAYHATKLRLFTEWVSCFQVLNLNEPAVQRIWQLCRHPVGYGVDCDAAEVNCAQLTATPKGLSGVLKSENAKFTFKTPLLGLFNAQNLTAAIAVLKKTGRPPLNSLLAATETLTPVEGRMEKLADKPVVILDYAHTPDALEALLKSVRAHYPQQALWLVFGAGGERDQGKRPLMGQVAAAYADRIILTSDNPRCEDPNAIMLQIAQGIQNKAYKTFPDRARAIQTAMQCAKADDVVVIAGKGHETEQVFCGETRPFNDREEVLKWLKP